MPVSLFKLFTLLYACAESTGAGQTQGSVLSFHFSDSRDPAHAGHCVWWPVPSPTEPFTSPASLLRWCSQQGFTSTGGRALLSVLRLRSLTPPHPHPWPLAARDGEIASPLPSVTALFISPTPQYVSSNKSDLFSVCAFV